MAIDVQSNVKVELVPIQKRECSEEFAYDDGPHGGTFFSFFELQMGQVHNHDWLNTC